MKAGRRRPRVHVRARILIWTFAAATVVWIVEGTYEGWIAYASATVTAYAAGVVLIGLDGYNLADLPGYVRVALSVIGIFSGWLIVGNIYQSYLDAGFGDAFHNFALLFAIPYAQGLLVAFFLWAGIREVRGSPESGAN